MVAHANGKSFSSTPNGSSISSAIAPTDKDERTNITTGTFTVANVATKPMGKVTIAEEDEFLEEHAVAVSTGV